MSEKVSICDTVDRHASFDTLMDIKFVTTVSMYTKKRIICKRNIVLVCNYYFFIFIGNFQTLLIGLAMMYGFRRTWIGFDGF